MAVANITPPPKISGIATPKRVGWSHYYCSQKWRNIQGTGTSTEGGQGRMCVLCGKYRTVVAGLLVLLSGKYRQISLREMFRRNVSKEEAIIF